MKRLLQAGNCFSMEANDIANTGDAADKNSILSI